jgi:hypothetical protein
MTTEEEAGGERRFVGEFDVGSITGVIGENLCIAEEINVRVKIGVIRKKM